jgi:hypothetical protein
MAMDSSHSTPSQPFKHIALSLSGGGVRAVGYHLGTLDYLNHLGMLSEIHTLSSVSGGSLIATGFALSQKKGESFQEFYDNVCEFLPELNTLEELLKTLKDPNPPVASGAKTLITSFATLLRRCQVWHLLGKGPGDSAEGNHIQRNGIQSRHRVSLPEKSVPKCHWQRQGMARRRGGERDTDVGHHGSLELHSCCDGANEFSTGFSLAR